MTEPRDSAVTAAELDELQKRLRGDFWVPGTRREHEAEKAIASLRKQLDEARILLSEIDHEAVRYGGKESSISSALVERIRAALAQRAPASPSPEKAETVGQVLSRFACKLSEWEEEYHDCDCPPHQTCGCHELRGIIQEMQYFDFTAEDAKQMLSNETASPSPGDAT